MRSLIVLFLFFLSSCGLSLRTPEFEERYAYVCDYRSQARPVEPSGDYFVLLLVDAAHLDYSNNRSLIGTMVKHPHTGSMRGDVGHAWVLLYGDGIELEGGHSGEVDLAVPKYFDGVMNYHIYGYADPSAEERKQPRYELNPIKYLWTTRQDGYFQRGNGGHRPTFAALVPISQEQYEDIRSLMSPRHYHYSEYAFTHHQCVSLVVQVAALAGLPLKHRITIPIESSVRVGRQTVRFWEDPMYSELTISSPDVLERELMRAVSEGRAADVTDWYCRHRTSKRSSVVNIVELPRKLDRLLSLSFIN